MPGDEADLVWDRAAAHRKEHLAEAAATLLSEFITRWPADPRRRKAELHRLHCLSRLQRWTEVESLARQAARDYPSKPVWQDYLAEAVFRQGRVGEAEALIEAAIEGHPERTEPRALRAAIQNRDADPPAGPRPKIRIWPPQRAFDTPREVIRDFVLKGLPVLPLISPETVFMTLGSCFADNLAVRLTAGGYRVNSECIGEEVNSTFANRHLLEWIEKGPVSAPTGVMDDFYGPQTRQRFRTAIETSDIFVLTLGVAPAFFHATTGEFAFIRPRSSTDKQFLYSQHVMRTTTVAENAHNVNAIIDGVRRMSSRNPHVVLTVSPTPLGGTTEFHSAAIADCLSKSTLRLACHEVVTERAKDRVLYWPSFEIVRWFGAHYGPRSPRVYGEHDSESRHVSPWLVDLIIELFLEHYAAAPAEPPA